MEERKTNNFILFRFIENKSNKKMIYLAVADKMQQKQQMNLHVRILDNLLTYFKIIVIAKVMKEII